MGCENLSDNSYLDWMREKSCILTVWSEKCLDGLFLQTQLCLLSDVNWWTGLVWITCVISYIYTCVLSAVWTLILTVMQCYISPNLMKKQTHLHLNSQRVSKLSHLYKAFAKWIHLNANKYRLIIARISAYCVHSPIKDWAFTQLWKLYCILSQRCFSVKRGFNS